MSEKIVKKFADGKETPREMNARLGIRMTCAGCGGRAMNRILIFADAKELVRRSPNIAAAIMATNPAGPFVPTVKTKWGEMVMMSRIGSCDACMPAAEKAVAKHPDWCFADIHRGPEDLKPTVQVAEDAK